VKDSNKLMNNFVATFPTITSVNLEAIINQAKNSISSASLAVQYIFLLTLIAGVFGFNCFHLRKQRSENQRGSHHACYWSQSSYDL
jgi:predicted lysophospholipase L1 biosynthesis ABC-type transport system permease subunit